MVKVASMKSFLRDILNLGGPAKKSSTNLLYRSQNLPSDAGRSRPVSSVKLAISQVAAVSPHTTVLSASLGPIKIPPPFGSEMAVIGLTDPVGVAEILISPQAVSMDGFSDAYNETKSQCHQLSYEVRRRYAIREVLGQLPHKSSEPASKDDSVTVGDTSPANTDDLTVSRKKKANYQKAVKQLLIRAVNEQAHRIRIVSGSKGATVQYQVHEELLTKHRWGPKVAEAMAQTIIAEIRSNKTDPFEGMLGLEVKGLVQIEGVDHIAKAFYVATDAGSFDLTVDLSTCQESAVIPSPLSIGLNSEHKPALQSMMNGPNGVIYVSSAGSVDAMGKVYSVAKLYRDNFPDKPKVVVVEQAGTKYQTDFEHLTYQEMLSTPSRDSQSRIIEKAVDEGAGIIVVDQVRSEEAILSVVDAVAKGVSCIIGHHANSALNALMSLCASNRVNHKAVGLGVVIGSIHMTTVPTLCSACSKPVEYETTDNNAKEHGASPLDEIEEKNQAWFTPQTRLRNLDGCQKCNKGVSGAAHAAEIIHIGRDLYPHLGAGDVEAVYDAFINHEMVPIAEALREKVATGVCCPLDTYRILGPANAYQRTTRVSPKRPSLESAPHNKLESAAPSKPSNIVTLNLDAPVNTSMHKS